MIAFLAAALLSEKIVRYSSSFGPFLEEKKIRLILNRLSVDHDQLKFSGQVVNVSNEDVPIYRPFPGPMVFVEWFLPRRFSAEMPGCFIPNLGGAESEFVPPWCGRGFDSVDQLRPVTPDTVEYFAAVNFVYDSRYIHQIFLGEQKNGWVPVPIGARVINGPYLLKMKGNRVLALLTQLGKYGIPAHAGHQVNLQETVDTTHPWVSQGY